MKISIKLTLVVIVGFILSILSATFLLRYRQTLVSPLGLNLLPPKPLLIYSFENLKKINFTPNQIILGKNLQENHQVVSSLFYFLVPNRPQTLQLLKASGILTRPTTRGTYPLIVLLRGYVDRTKYHPGVGSQAIATQLASQGFITLAPDFLGYGESASPSANPFEERFQTYTTALSLLASVSSINKAFETQNLPVRVDPKKIGLWGHSNGGQIALSILAISGADYPTVLWAPVSKSFPYSILYFTDETDDQGKYLRQTLAKFEKDYDSFLFSPPNYYFWIRAPVQIIQGSADQEVPIWWSNELVDKLRKIGVAINYHTYPGADHNLLPNSWSAAVYDSINFWRRQFNE